MINLIRQWWFKRRVAEEVRIVALAAARVALRAGGRHAGIFSDAGYFYSSKYCLRDTFPAANMIEIAEGVVTVAQGNLIARVAAN